MAFPALDFEKFGDVILDISNSVLPFEKLQQTPSSKEGLSAQKETQIRLLGCDLIQVAGKLLKLPQVAMATGCVLFQRFYYAKSFVRIPFETVAMGCVCLACKIEESPRRVRDIINVFAHIKQVRSGKRIHPVVLDASYIALKNQVIKAERRVLKELGFCVHVSHPHKIIVMYLRWLELDQQKDLLQLSWNFMNDSLRTDVFVCYPPETIAAACIFLSARKTQEPLPKNPFWFSILNIEEEDIIECSHRIIAVYNQEKPNQSELEAHIDELKAKLDLAKKSVTVKTESPLNQDAVSPLSYPSNVDTTASSTSVSTNANGVKARLNNKNEYIKPRENGNGCVLSPEDLKSISIIDSKRADKRKKHSSSRSKDVEDWKVMKRNNSSPPPPTLLDKRKKSESKKHKHHHHHRREHKSGDRHKRHRDSSPSTKRRYHRRSYEVVSDGDEENNISLERFSDCRVDFYRSSHISIKSNTHSGDRYLR